MVLRVGDGVTPLGAGPSPISLLSYDTLSGGLTSTVALPSSTPGLSCTLAGNSSALEGSLSLSLSGDRLCAVCSNANVGAFFGAPFSKVMVRVDPLNSVDTSFVVAASDGLDAFTSVLSATDGEAWVGQDKAKVCGTNPTTTVAPADAAIPAALFLSGCAAG